MWQIKYIQGICIPGINEGMHVKLSGWTDWKSVWISWNTEIASQLDYITPL